MKKYAVLFCLICICLLSANNFAQSRRATVPDENTSGKINKRPPQSASTPKPESATTDEEPNNTNIERVSPPVETNTETDGDVITVNTEMVSVPVKILDRKGRFISGLNKENFQVLEDNVPQEIAYFSNEQQPFTVALVLDMSISSTFKIAEIQSAAMAFVNQLRPNDKVMVVAFNEEVLVLSPPTSDRNALQRAIKSTAIGPGTSLYEAVDLVINQKLKNIAGRKAIVLFTDGVDTTSRKANDLSNLSDALELDALVYPIEYDTFNDVQAMKNKSVTIKPPSPIPSQNKSPFPFPIPTSGIGTPSSQGSSAEDYRRADQYLHDMADRTGGRLYQASTTANLAQAFSNIAAELREYYSLGYYPTEKSKEAKSHKIKVRVDKEGLVVRARQSYAVGGKDKKDKKGK
jgi:VWFA-related protein